MHLLIRSFLLFFFLLPHVAYSAATPDKSHIVLVSVSPHKFFVEKIAGSTVQVIVMVPAGASAHTYEPTPKEMLKAAKGDIWFQIGEPFEKKAGTALLSHQPRMRLVDLRKGLDLISSQCHCHNHEGMEDLHFWLSARMAKQQAVTIADALIDMYPENTTLYQDNLRRFTGELDQLDAEISEQFRMHNPNPLIMVSHPAYAYFCRDYGLTQLSIEISGKDPTAQQLTHVIQQARHHGISTIFIQKQYSNKGPKLIAKELNAQLVMLDPYSEDYLNTMRTIAHHFCLKNFRGSP